MNMMVYILNFKCQMGWFMVMHLQVFFVLCIIMKDGIDMVE